MRDFKAVLEHLKVTWENHPRIPPGAVRDIETVLRSSLDPVPHSKRLVALWRDIASRLDWRNSSQSDERDGLYQAATELDVAIAEFLQG